MHITEIEGLFLHLKAVFRNIVFTCTTVSCHGNSGLFTDVRDLANVSRRTVTLSLLWPDSNSALQSEIALEGRDLLAVAQVFAGDLF